MTHNQLIGRIRDFPEDPDDIFALIRSISYFAASPDTKQDEALDLIIRLLDRRPFIVERLKGSGKMLDAISREAGLYPYMEGPHTWHEEIALDLVKAPGTEGIHFHIEQAKVFMDLLEGKSLILSAPTSFGKSLLIDTLIAAKKPRTVVACVPTIALLDEFRRRMKTKFRDYQIIATSAKLRDQARSAIIIGTQERLRERNDLTDVDLFVLDEFYKLDLSRGDTRSICLNALLGSVGRRAKQIYLLGPSIDEVPERETFRSDIHFHKTTYSPVTADIISRMDVGASIDNLVEDLKKEKESSNLIYIKSPPASWQLGFELLKRRKRRGGPLLEEFGDWLLETYHPEWILGQTLKKGIGIHHGRVPRSVAHLLVELFNREELKILLCTSSMIEGVNTTAECVFIFDRKINTKKLDRFTFDNIKGRAGRLKKHAVGKIYLYEAPPETSVLEVDIPLFGDQSRYSNELLFQIEPEFLNGESLTRRQQVASSSTLSPAILERWSEFGVESLDNLADSFAMEALARNSNIVWIGFPKFNQLVEVLGLAWSHLKFPRHGLRSPRQAAYFAIALYQNRYSMRNFFDQLVQEKGLAAQPQIDLCFNFLRAAEYTLPQILRALDDIASEVMPEAGVDYTAFATMLQNHFLPEGYRSLDELGVPIGITSKILDPRESDEIDPEALAERWEGQSFEQLSNFENDLLQISLG